MSYASVVVLYYLFCGWIICASDGSILPVLWLDHIRQWWFYTTCSVIGSYASVMVLYYLFCGWIICVSDGSILLVLWLDNMRQWWFYTTCSVVGQYASVMILYYLFCGWIICVSGGSILPVLWLDHIRQWWFYNTTVSVVGSCHMRQWWFYTTCSVIGSYASVMVLYYMWSYETKRCMIRTSSKRIYWSSVIVLLTHLPARLVYPVVIWPSAFYATKVYRLAGTMWDSGLVYCRAQNRTQHNNLS